MQVFSMNLPSIDCIRVVVSNWTLWNVSVAELKMDTMASVWNVVENVRVTSGAVELAIFTAILYWFFTSSRVADMLELVGERVGGWCGRDPPTTIRQASRTKRRHNADVYARLEQERNVRASSLYKVKNHASVPLPEPPQQPSTGLACARCAPKSRESWQDSKTSSIDNGPVINILDIGRQNFANGGVLSRYFCDFAQCSQLPSYDFKDVVPDVIKDESFQRAIDETTERELMKDSSLQVEANRESLTLYTSVRRRVEGRAVKVLRDISSAMSTRVLKLVAWLCHKAIRRVAGGGCGTRGGAVARIARARASGLPLVFVPLHRSHFDYVLVTFTLYLMGIRPPLVAAGDNMRIPFFGWFLRGCGAFYIKRKVNGSEHNGDSVYKTALRSYILHSLSNKNNLEFFIEGGRTRTGKPQPPKAGILSVIMDAYLDGTIDDALLVPVTLNYDRLVDGNFVREQLGRPKQMETFWSALRGIWRTLNTDHGGIRVDFNQPISLKELVTSFQRYNYLQEPVENNLATLTNNNLGSSLDRQILYSNSHSSLYGADVTHTHKMTVEAIGRHLVYDASQATAIMSTNLVAYVLLCESRARPDATTSRVCSLLESRHAALSRDGRDLTHAPHANRQLKHALDMLGRTLVRREGSGDKQVLKAVHSIPANIELAYYANTIIAHYAPQAIVVTAIESILCSQDADQNILSHSEVITQSLVLSAILSQELILCPPCRRTEELLEDTMQALADAHVFNVIQVNEGLEEQQWSRRFARQFDDEDEEEMVDRTNNLKYRVNRAPEALAERRRLLLTLRPLLEGYSATCHCLTAGKQSHTVERTLEHLTQQFVLGDMTYGEAVSTDAIRNCMKMLKQWGIIDIDNEGKDRIVSLRQPYESRQEYDKMCQNVYKFNMNSPLLANDNVSEP